MNTHKEQVKFFYPDGREINKEDFVCFYSKCYYLKNCAVAEREIEDILVKGIDSKEPVMKVLRWKLNAIDHLESQATNITAYNKGEIGFETKTPVFKKPVHAEQICDYISKNISRLSTMPPKEIYYELASLKNETTNLGPVCLLTLVYFITQGKSQI